MTLATTKIKQISQTFIKAYQGVLVWSWKEKSAWLAAVFVSIGLLIGGNSGQLEFGIVETLGFITGAWCVWLCVKENIWNWPIGVANAAFLLVVFAQAHLFADSSLQVIYIILGALGWYFWLHGGEAKKKLHIGTTGWKQWLVLSLVLGVGTYAMMQILLQVNDSAPFLDALTTTSSLIAQYMLTRKLIENWWIWLVTDVVYIGLYSYRHLYLTAVLYAIFFVMCIIGLKKWYDTLKIQRLELPALELPGVAIPTLLVEESQSLKIEDKLNV